MLYLYVRVCMYACVYVCVGVGVGVRVRVRICVLAHAAGGQLSIKRGLTLTAGGLYV